MRVVAPDDIVELFSVFGPVTVRRMFGGAGIFAEGLSIAIVHDGVIYLKVDAQSAPDFEREKLPPFTYMRGGAPASLTSYRRMPDRLYDDPDELARWVRNALAAAMTGAGRKTSAPQAAEARETKAVKLRRRRFRRPSARPA